MTESTGTGLVETKEGAAVYTELVDPGKEGLKRENTSFTPQTQELEAMENNPFVAVYELLQNLSYGLWGKPPPAVLLVNSEGERVVFNGVPEDFPDDVVEVQFITAANEGFSPTDATQLRHRETGDSLGHWGRGGKQAVCYLLNINSDTEVVINSPYTVGGSEENKNWLGQYVLDDTVDKKSKQLNLEWKEVDQKFKQTIVSIKNPSQKFLEGLKHAADAFLFVNPDYGGGVFVPGDKNKDAGVDYSYFVGVMTVEVLSDTLLSKRSEGRQQEGVFVDGLLCSTGTRQLFVYNFINGLKEKNNNSLSISRAEDSARVSGIDNISSRLDSVFPYPADLTVFSTTYSAPPEHQYLY